jgi:hypothetical protein
MRLGVFVYFHMWFLLWFLGSRRAFCYFYVIKPLFYSKKVSTCHVHALTSRCRLWCLGGVWGPIWWPNMSFCHVIWCTTVLFFLWGGMYQHIMVDFLPKVISFFFFFIFSLFQRKCTLVLFSLDLSISVFFIVYCCPLSKWFFFYLHK